MTSAGILQVAVLVEQQAHASDHVRVSDKYVELCLGEKVEAFRRTRMIQITWMALAIKKCQ